MKKAKWFVCGLVILSGLVAGTALAKSYVVTQNHKKFQFDGKNISDIEIKAGDSIKFLNEDKLFHNIFSMSKVMNFNIGAYGTGESETVTFNKIGTIAVECGIHPRMMLEVEVGK